MPTAELIELFIRRYMDLLPLSKEEIEMVLALMEKRGIDIYDDVGVERVMAELFGDLRENALEVDRLLNKLRRQTDAGK